MTGTPCVLGVRVSSSCITIQKSNYQLCKQSVYHLTIWDLSSCQSRAASKCAFRAINCCCGIRDSVRNLTLRHTAHALPGAFCKEIHIHFATLLCLKDGVHLEVGLSVSHLT